ncbi:BTAD domain-containing putative transcriptional regulator [Streptomyces sp. NPDC048337]|uniref:BTAD domain-containing putative transcriptional regulator n=1 Tax=Streptomyces sp. NPDC048337 TaxID=3365535 RepID=UPI00371DB734
MHFRLLGPLEALAADTPVSLGGAKQRATLGYLLLHANRVVATSRLLRALWDAGDSPPTARKILQNAVWGLRGVLAGAPSDPRDPSPAPELLTQAPGYMLRIDPELVDLSVFQQRATQGRAELAAGAPETAAALLREGLALWRGPVLSDLAETGISWPELDAANKVRLDAMEDLFDAELSCGHHHSALGGIELLVDAEPLRERACGQLMLALYRCGRQADALNVYDRVRSALVENLGLEPGRGLQMLQRAILTHDPALTLDDEPMLYGTRPAARPSVRLTGEGERNGNTLTALPTPVEARTAPAPARPEPATPGPGARVPAQPSPSGPVARRVPVSTLLVSTRGGGDLIAPLPEELEDLDGTLDRLRLVIQEEVEAFGGLVAATIGSVTLALFGAGEPSSGKDPEQAVRAGVAIRDLLSAEPGVLVRAAVTTGSALVRHRPDMLPHVSGTLLDEGQALLARVPDGEVWINGPARLATAHIVTCQPASDLWDSWRVGGVCGQGGCPAVDRVPELGILSGLLDWARDRSVPHLVTVLGDPGVGRTHLLMEFTRSVSEQSADAARIVVARAGGTAGPLDLPAEILARCCRIRAGDSPSTAQEKLASVIRTLPLDPVRQAQLRAGLLPLLPRSDARTPGAEREILDRWGEFIVALAGMEPLVVAIDDLHRADPLLLDRIESLADSAGEAALLLVVTARTELLEQRMDWGGGKRRVSTITLLPPVESPVSEPLPNACPV